MWKFVILASMMILAAGTVSQAQAQRGGGEQFILKYGEQLELSDDQKEQILALASERRSEFRERARNDRQRGGERGNREQMQNRHMESMEGFRSEFNDILTDGQAAELRQLRAAEIDEQTELTQLRHSMMVEQAGIEGDKAQTVLAIMNRNAAAMADMRKELILSGEEITREAMQAQREQMKEAHEEIKNLLTAAEYEKLQQQMRSNRPAGMRMMMNRRSR